MINSAALEKAKLLELCCSDVVQKFCERENGLEALRDTMQRELRELRSRNGVHARISPHERNRYVSEEADPAELFGEGGADASVFHALRE